MQRAAQNLSVALASLGVDVAVLAFGGGGPREAVLRGHNIPVFISDIANAVNAAAGWHPDIIHIHRSGYPKPRETALLKHLRPTCRKIIETNIFARYDFSEGGHLIDAHCLLSKWCVFKWRAWGGARSGKRWFVLPNSFETEVFRPIDQTQRAAIRAELNIAEHDFVLGRIAQPHIEKWSYGMIGAFRSALTEHNTLRLLLVGAPAQIVAQIAKQPVEVGKRIIQMPTTSSDERLVSLLSAMDGFLHMSMIGECHSMALCEAMLAGIPIVTQSTPLKDNGQLEQVGHEKGGLVALSEDAVPEAISRLVTDHQLRTYVKRNAPIWMKQQFALDVMGRKAVDIYEQVLSDNRSPRVEDEPPDRAWIEKMWSLGIGQPPSLKTKVLFGLVHTPLIYRAYTTARSWKQS
jgi:glycosyltransferase involved in cell wall biosynthesis